MDNNMQIYYQQLSEDWRMRDRMVWQMPSYLVIIGGVLLVSLYSKQFAPDDPFIKTLVLTAGLGFSWIIKVYLTRSIYLQAVGQDLLENITNGTNLGEVKKLTRRVPLCRGGYTLRRIYFDLYITFSSFLLLLFCSAFVGMFIYLLAGKIGMMFGIGTGLALLNVVLIIWVSRKFFNDLDAIGHRWAGMGIIVGYNIIVAFTLYYLLICKFNVA